MELQLFEKLPPVTPHRCAAREEEIQNKQVGYVSLPTFKDFAKVGIL